MCKFTMTQKSSMQCRETKNESEIISWHCDSHFDNSTNIKTHKTDKSVVVGRSHSLIIISQEFNRNTNGIIKNIVVCLSEIG